MSEDEPADQGQELACGHPTRSGGLCSRSPMAGSPRCHQHAGLEATEAEREASRMNPVEHGYYFSGFVDEDERELFQAVADGAVDLALVQRQVIGALVVRAVRLLEREAEDPNLAGLTTSAFAELRKALGALDPDALTIQHTVDFHEVQAHVQEVLGEDPQRLAGLVPEEEHDAVREALG